MSTWRHNSEERHLYHCENIIFPLCVDQQQMKLLRETGLCNSFPLCMTLLKGWLRLSGWPGSWVFEWDMHRSFLTTTALKQIACSFHFNSPPWKGKLGTWCGRYLSCLTSVCWIASQAGKPEWKRGVRPLMVLQNVVLLFFHLRHLKGHCFTEGRA